MNQKILDLIESSSPFEVDLSETYEMLTADDILLIAKYRPDLESLTLDLIDQEALKHLPVFQKLKKFFLNDAACLSWEGEWVDSICSLSQLTHLAIHRYHDMDEVFLKKLCTLQHLVSINFAHSHRINEENVQFFFEFKHLRFLNINNAGYLEDSEITFITRLTNLEGLELAYTNFSKDGYQQLSDLHNLKYLDLSGTKISDESLKLFSTSLFNLELLDLNDCHNITEQGLLYLNELPKLRLINMNNCPQISKNLIQKIPSLKVTDNTNYEVWRFWNSLTKNYQ